MINRLHWILFWFAEILIPAAVSVGFVVFLYTFFYLSARRVLPIESAGISFVGMWLPFVLLYSRGMALKLQIWRRLPREERTLEEARLILRACAERGLWRLPKSSPSESDDKTI
jgi:hypothetical protein